MTKTARERAIEAIDAMPESMQRCAADFLQDRIAKYRTLKRLIDEGLADIEAGHVHEWDFDEFMRKARLRNQNVDGRDKPGHDG